MNLLAREAAKRIAEAALVAFVAELATAAAAKVWARYMDDDETTEGNE